MLFVSFKYYVNGITYYGNSISEFKEISKYSDIYDLKDHIRETFELTDVLEDPTKIIILNMIRLPL